MKNKIVEIHMTSYTELTKGQMTGGGHMIEVFRLDGTMRRYITNKVAVAISRVDRINKIVNRNQPKHSVITSSWKGYYE